VSQILTIIIDVDGEKGVAVNFFESDGLTGALALAAVEAVQRELQRRVFRAELEAERAKVEADDGTDDRNAG